MSSKGVYIMKKIFDLPVCGSDRAKSFYGKAKIIETEKPKAADMTSAESLKAMYNRRAANNMNY